ncbi:MAG: Uma2 family endonuclease [Rhodocyclaceae bacterium]|nr:Uma2 family endonuclease [Rhodocyclaceae bacterium]MBX3667254.1 Uma2 family endonuclease [Rhodocyclaceae bacterium]
MGRPAEKPALTLAEFMAWENKQPDKHEFVHGEVFAMVGARRVHVAVAGNCFALLKQHLRATPCRAFASDMKLQVATNIFYPDVLVSCDPGDLQADLSMQHPRAIIEVLSDSTAAYDRGEKFAAYRQIASLQEYALIDPDRLSIEVFRRTPEGDWLLAASEAGRGLILKTLDFIATPAQVFEDISGSVEQA